MNTQMPVATDVRTKTEQYETLREKLIQERDELGDEWLFEEFGMPPALPVWEQWNRNPRELVSVIQFFNDQ